MISSHLEIIDGIRPMQGKKYFNFHIERKKQAKNERGIKGGRIIKLKLYENGKLVALYNRRWEKQPIKQNAKSELNRLLKIYN